MKKVDVCFMLLDNEAGPPVRYDHSIYWAYRHPPGSRRCGKLWKSTCPRNANADFAYGKLAMPFFIFCVLAGSPVRCQWRNLPACYAHSQAVYHYFVKWKHNGCLNSLLVKA